jgi:hypothetical protein
MAQWGTERSFVTDDIVIRVIADVDTGSNTFAPLVEDSVVHDLILTHVTGPRDAVMAFLATLKDRYVGKSYSEWRS